MEGPFVQPMSELTRDPNRVDVWITFVDRIHDAHLLRAYEQMLDGDERRRHARLHFENDRHRYLVTRALVRTTLSRYGRRAPTDWSFSRNEYGKPHVAKGASDVPGLSFNVSHACNLAVLAIAWNRSVGIDVENVAGRRSAVFDIGQRYFSEIEAAALLAQPLGRRDECFCEYWTLKEAYIKARGMGLSIPLDRFAILIDDANVALLTSPDVDDDAARWHFWQLRCSEDYVVAVCAECPDECGSAPRLSYRGIVPLDSEQPPDMALVRSGRGER
jgi:4'-phosphopantetheinyl transferase